MCSNYLILTIGNDEITLMNDMSVQYGRNQYTAEEASRFTLTKDYTINQVGDSILFKLKSEDVQIHWHSSGDFSIMVNIHTSLDSQYSDADTFLNTFLKVYIHFYQRKQTFENDIGFIRVKPTV